MIRRPTDIAATARARGALACVLALWLVAPAIAADLQYQVVTSDSPKEIGRRVDRLAEQGYRVLAIVADAPSTTLVLSRDNKGLRKNVAIAEYRVLDGRDNALVHAAGVEGYRLRAVGRGQLARPVAVLERMLGAPVAPHDYRAEQVAPGADVEPVLAAAGAEGYRAIAAVGDAASEWIILERPDGAPPRDVRVVSGTGVPTVEAAINALAKDGFDVDAVWNRAPKGFGLFRDPTLMCRGREGRTGRDQLRTRARHRGAVRGGGAVPRPFRLRRTHRRAERLRHAGDRVDQRRTEESVGRVAVPGDPAPRVVEADRGGLGRHLGQQGHALGRARAAVAPFAARPRGRHGTSRITSSPGTLAP
jgi:hypothetical protein